MVVIVVSTNIVKSLIGVGQIALCHQPIESHEKLSLLQITYISTTNCAFSPATPIDHTYQCNDIVLLYTVHA